MMTKQHYIDYLLNTPVNYTCSNLAEHLDGVSHDAVSDFLQRGRVTANGLWEMVRPLLKDSEDAVLIVDDSVQGSIHLKDIDWTTDRLQNGVMVKLKELPFKVRLFKIVATNGDIDWIITNFPDPIDALAVAEMNARRWPIEQFHRELNQLTGSEKCQTRKARSQRNHLGYSYLAWLALKVRAAQCHLTLYQVRLSIFDEFLTMALQKPPIPAYLPT